MTEKDFINLADALKATREDSLFSMDTYNQWVRDVNAVSDACLASNPRLNCQHWIDYIIGESNTSDGILYE